MSHQVKDVNLVLYGCLHPDAVAYAKGLGFSSVTEVEQNDRAHLDEAMKTSHALALRYHPLSNETLLAAPGLRVVSRHGVGCDNVDVDTLNARNIPLWITGNVNSETVAEHALMLMLATARRAVSCHRMILDGRYHGRDTSRQTEALGKTLLIVGYGKIGQALARLVQGLNMRILVHDPYLKNVDHTVETVPLTEGLAQADFVSLHTPAGEQLLDEDKIKRTKRGAIIINTARGGLIDLDALQAGLESGHLAGAGLDVFPQEPPRPHPLFDSPAVTLSPHTAAMTDECMYRMGLSTIDNIVASLSKRFDPALIFNYKFLTLG